jgi:hypothetical protein
MSTVVSFVPGHMSPQLKEQRCPQRHVPPLSPPPAVQSNGAKHLEFHIIGRSLRSEGNGGIFYLGRGRE